MLELALVEHIQQTVGMRKNYTFSQVYEVLAALMTEASSDENPTRN